jgi:acetyl esterase/lipase
VRARTKWIVGLVVLVAVGAASMIGLRSGEPAGGAQAACPQFKPLHGLMPWLFRLGVLPKPPIAASIAPSDTSSSVVIRPDPQDQIQCGKTAVRTIRNVVFATPVLAGGKTASLKMDLLIPQSTRKRTLVVYVPGGGFVMAAKEAALNLRTYVAEAGFVVASVEYRTSRDGANFRDGVEDIKAAIRYLRVHAGDYGIDAGTVAVWGESAGGYLAAMVGVTNGNGAFDTGSGQNPGSDVQGVIVDFGASDIGKIAADYDTATQQAMATNEGLVRYIGKAPGSNSLDRELAATAANPLNYIKSGAPPFLIFHGNQDRMVSPSQTLILHQALLADGVQSTRYVVDGAGHGDLGFIGDTQSGLLWSTNKVMNLIVDFLDGLHAGN